MASVAENVRDLGIAVLSLLGPVEEVVCYGLGNFERNPSGQVQTALLEFLDRKLRPERGTSVFDPLFSTVEARYLAEAGLRLLDVNEEARRPAAVRTLFFMPHCSRKMYDNLLAANWDPLRISRIALLGNSFADYRAQAVPPIVERRTPHVSICAPPFVNETDLPELELADARAFHRQSLHRFNPHVISDLHFWNVLEPAPQDPHASDIISP